LTPLEIYLKEMREIRSSGEAVPEASHYGPLEGLLNEIGKTLSPKVRCVINIKNRSAGIPDGGFFTSDQLGRTVTDEVRASWGGQPARGVLEVKSPTADVRKVAEGKQVAAYWAKYGQVLVTNYRDFLLVGRDAYGKQANLESYTLAESESAFWEATTHARKTANLHEKRLTEYLIRVMLSAAELRLPENLAWLLASYARDAREQIDKANLSDLNDLRSKLQAVLGITFGGEDGERFFRSTLIQTIFYGIFAAWVLWCRETPFENSAARFDWRVAGFELRVPILKKLFEQVATSSNLEALRLLDILNWTGSALNRVNRRDFFRNFEEAHAVQYFYEPFLEAFDPKLRKEMGVWYTPPEIVKYMVERVDQVLREELDEADGLASRNVYVLDPGCGTGAYLVEVLRRIEQTLREKGEEALIGEEIKNAAMHRVFGFEILPASFVISHLEINSLLRRLDGIKFSGEERPAIYLTNALTGWERVPLPKQLVTESQFKQEWEAAARVKRETPILVVIGNPPYNAFAGVSPDEEAGLVEAYKKGLIDEWGIKKFNLDDLYVRFFRLAERRIAEMTGRGIVCFVSNFSYLGDPSFVVMRQSLLHNFDTFWFDCLNGDSRETGKLTPEGRPDPSVFSTKYNKAGIRVGTAIALMTRKKRREKHKTVYFRHFWGKTKKQELLESVCVSDISTRYTVSKPHRNNRFTFRPSAVAEYYSSWPKLTELCGVPPLNGPIERRGGSLIAMKEDKGRLRVLEAYLDSSNTDNEILLLEPRFMASSGEFDAQKTRASLAGKVEYDETKISFYPFKPFDVRVAYLDRHIQPLFSRPSPELLSVRSVSGQGFLISRDTADRSEEGPPFYFSPLVCDYDSISGHARHFPIVVGSFKDTTSRADSNHKLFPDRSRSNLSLQARQYLVSLLSSRDLSGLENAALLWMHALAVGYCPQYLSENGDGIRQDWPRIPLPDSRKLLLESAELGRQVAALLDSENPLNGVSSGSVRPELKGLGVVSHLEGKKIDAAKGDLDVNVDWGHPDKRGATMPGQGKAVEREYESAELHLIEMGAAALGLSPDDILGLIGETTLDVYLNEAVYWKNIPLNVWGYRIGGYQVIKKWLSYRDKKVLGRSLTVEEVREVTNMARRLAAIILLQPQLNSNYQQVKESTYHWEYEESGQATRLRSGHSTFSAASPDNQVSLPFLLATRE